MPDPKKDGQCSEDKDEDPKSEEAKKRDRQTFEGRDQEVKK